MRNAKRSSRVAVFVLGLALVASGSACASEGGAGAGADTAEDYPKRPISWIVPYAPGGGSDRQVRRLQPYMEKSLGKKINVVYKDGGDGAVGWQQLSTAKPDGYTIANVVAPNVMLLELTGNTGYESQKFEYVSWTETAPNVLVVSKKSKYKTVEDFVAAAKAKPDKLTVAGTGKTGELSWAEMSKAMGIKASYVPVSGGVGDIVPDLQGGHVDAAVFGASHATEYADALHPLTITGTEDVDALSDVPTLDSKGFKGAELGTSWGVIAPEGTSDAIVQKLNKAVRDAMKQQKVQDTLAEGGLTSLDQSPQQARAYAEEQRKGVTAANEQLGK